jgi:hypothetical protein
MDPAVDFAMAVQGRSWAWLFEIGSSLSVDVRIVDLRGAPVLPASDATPAALRDPEFGAAVGRAQRHESIQTVQIERTFMACGVVRLAGSHAGVLVVSRRLAAEGSPQNEHWRLEQIASFLRSAVEAHLVSEIARFADEVQRLTALRRSLDECVGGSEQDVIRVFGDAVSIWEDVDVRAYREGLDGEYVLEWMPPGAAEDDVPAIPFVPPSLLTRELAQVPDVSRGQLRVVASEHLVVAEIVPDKSRWMLIFSRAVDPACANRLSLYVDILEQSMKQLAVATTLRLSRALWDRLLEADQHPARAAEAAVAEIVAALRADFGGLIVTAPDGRRAVAVGEIGRFADIGRPAGAGQLATSLALEPGGTLTLAVGRNERRPPFSIAERDLLESVMDVLGPWAAAIGRRPAATGDRRQVTRSFEQVIEEVTSQTLRSGGSVSVVVIRLAASGARPGAAHRLAAQIRSHLRAAEPAGALTDAEIAAVLFDANADQARAVMARLRGLGASLDDGEALASAAMGVAHCGAGAPCDTSLIVAAREDALRSGRANSSLGRLQ